MPKASEQSRRQRHLAEERLAQSYGWPSPRRSRWRHRAMLVGVVFADAAIVLLSVVVCAYLLGWRP